MADLSKVDIPSASDIAQWWVDNAGATPQAAQAIARSVNVESGGNPNAFNSAGGGQGAYGTHQWRGPRQAALKQLDNWSDWRVQQQFALSELRGGDPQAAKVADQILTSTDTNQAYRLWRDNFGRGEDSAGYKSGLRGLSSGGFLQPNTVAIPTMDSTAEAPPSNQVSMVLPDPGSSPAAGGSMLPLLALGLVAPKYKFEPVEYDPFKVGQVQQLDAKAVPYSTRPTQLVPYKLGTLGGHTLEPIDHDPWAEPSP